MTEVKYAPDNLEACPCGSRQVKAIHEYGGWVMNGECVGDHIVKTEYFCNFCGRKLVLSEESHD